jgi:response regulator RpfG family c-di-GMP phosphodiesterase
MRRLGVMPVALKNEHTLLLVDDEKSITKALNRLFRKEGYRIMTAQSGAEGLEKLQQSDHPVSMIISDQRMPEMNGAAFLEKAKSIYPDAVRYLLTGYSDLEAVVDAVNKGEIHRYLTKPWNDEDLVLQVKQSLEHFELISENRRLTALTIEQNKKVNELNKGLEQKVQERTKEVFEKNKALEKVNQMLEASFMDSIRLLVSLVEILNPKLGRQMRQVAQLARQVAEAFELEKSELDKIEMAGMIHDIGLLGFPEELRCKEIHQMSEEQGRLYSDHPTIASILLENVEKLSDVGEIVLYHHEYFNGKGFPNGLKGNQIPLGSRIVLAASDYCQILSTWPRDQRKLIAYTRRHFDAETWKSFTVSDDPDVIIEEAAEKKLLSDCNQKYDVEVVSALIKKIRENKKIDPTFNVSLDKVKAGMVLMEDLKLNDGRLLLTKGTRLKATSIESIISIGERGLIPNTLTVSAPKED